MCNHVLAELDFQYFSMFFFLFCVFFEQHRLSKDLGGWIPFQEPGVFQTLCSGYWHLWETYSVLMKAPLDNPTISWEQWFVSITLCVFVCVSVKAAWLPLWLAGGGRWCSLSLSLHTLSLSLTHTQVQKYAKIHKMKPKSISQRWTWCLLLIIPSNYTFSISS